MIKNQEESGRVFISPNMLWGAAVARMLNGGKSGKKLLYYSLSDDFEQKELKNLIVMGKSTSREADMEFNQITKFQFSNDVRDWDNFYIWCKQFTDLVGLATLARKVIDLLHQDIDTEFWSDPMMKIDSYYMGWAMRMFNLTSDTEKVYSPEEFFISDPNNHTFEYLVVSRIESTTHGFITRLHCANDNIKKLYRANTEVFESPESIDEVDEYDGGDFTGQEDFEN